MSCGNDNRHVPENLFGDNFSTLVEKAQQKIALIDRDLCIVYVNSYQETFNTLVPGQSINTYVLASRHSAFVSALDNVFTSRTTVTIETAMLAGESVCDVRVNLIPLGTTEEGLTVGLMFSDLTNQKYNAQARQTSEDYYRLIFNSVPVSIVQTDVYGVIVDINPNHISTLGRGKTKKSDYVGTNILEHASVVSSGVVSQYRCVLSGQSISLTDVEFPQLIGGHHATFNISGVPLMDDGSVVGAVFIHEDITKQKEHQQQCQTMSEQVYRMQKMEAIGQLTGGLAHDFNNLLTVVQGNSKIISSLPDLPDVVYELARKTTDVAQRAESLTQRLLACGRRESLVPQVANLGLHVLGMQDMLQQALGRRIVVEVDTMAGLWRNKVDLSGFEGAILNLAINARDAMPDGGQLTIRMRNRFLEPEMIASDDLVKPGAYVAFSISDTGTGMAADILDQIFEPFFTTKNIDKGSGLGLSMVSGYVRQSGGYISVSSNVGSGTSIIFYLPRTYEEVEDMETNIQAPDTSRNAGFTILIVEDEPELRALAVRLLQRRGYKTAVAAGTTEAIEFLSDTPDVDLIFADVVLSGGPGGLALAAQVHKQWPSIPFIFTSGYSREIIQGEMVQADDGATMEPNILLKPFTSNELYSMVASTLGEKD